MRKRCFLIAVIAAIFGAVMVFVAYPSGKEMRSALREAEKRERWGNPTIGFDQNTAKRFFENAKKEPWSAEKKERMKSQLTPELIDRDQLVVSYAAFGLSGLLFLVGFIVGPPKETTSKSPPEES